VAAQAGGVDELDQLLGTGCAQPGRRTVGRKVLVETGHRPLADAQQQSGKDLRPSVLYHSPAFPDVSRTLAVVFTALAEPEADACSVEVVLTALGLDPPSSGLGVPARFAHPGPSGPLGNHTSRATNPATEAATAPARTPARSGHPALARIPTATSTTSTQPAATASIQGVFTSLPVPSECTSATGHEA
jgi:hypothetical protein